MPKSCMCGDTGCPSCGTAQGTLATGDEQAALARAARKVAGAMAELRDAWIDAEGCDEYGHPADIEGYPFSGNLDDVVTDVRAFYERAAHWARDVEKRREAEKGPG